jgi:hypothetical protein
VTSAMSVVFAEEGTPMEPCPVFPLRNGHFRQYLRHREPEGTLEPRGILQG